MSVAVASRYARALADLTFAGKADADTLAVDLAGFAAVLAESRELRTIMASPAVAISRKRAVADKLADQIGLSPIGKSVVSVIIERGRLEMLRLIRETFVKIVDERRGVVEVHVISAVELSAAERQPLEARIAELTGRTPRCVYQIDSKVIGGVLVRVGSQVYDGSVRGRLAGLAQQLSVPV